MPCCFVKQVLCQKSASLMEYNILIHNSFATFDVINQLAGRGSFLSFPQDSWIGSRSFVGGNFDPHLSSGALSQLRHSVYRKPVHEARDFSVYQVSSKGSLAIDYYHLPDKRTLIYDRRMRFAYWEQISAKPYADSEVLDSPLGHAIVNSPFGKIRGGKPHPGTDYPVAGGTPYHATAKGIVVKAGFSSTYGNVVILDHGLGYANSARVYTLYAHASKLLVHERQEVKTGDVVSLTGNTGRVFPPPPKGFHGHYEVIQTNETFGSFAFYAFKNKHKPTDLKKLLKGL
jgi:murein DD-endopeptidase MepM/ murein hydrolase activator NlpD